MQAKPLPFISLLKDSSFPGTFTANEQSTFLSVVLFPTVKNCSSPPKSLLRVNYFVAGAADF
jgi:hypothetical protein